MKEESHLMHAKMDELTSVVFSLRDGQEELVAQFISFSDRMDRAEGTIVRVQSDVTDLKEGQERQEQTLQRHEQILQEHGELLKRMNEMLHVLTVRLLHPRNVVQ